MTDYRLYIIQSGHIRAVHCLTADTDEEAVAQAEEHCQGEPAELWNRDRLVAGFGLAHERFG